MEDWSDGLVRSGIVPLIVESQFDDENQWCDSRALTKIGLAVYHRPEIRRYLPSLDKIDVAVRYGLVRWGGTQGWSAQGFPPNSSVRVSVITSSGSIVLGDALVTDERGGVEGVFTVGTNIPAETVVLYVRSVSEPSTYGETDFTVESSATMALKHSSDRFNIYSDFENDISWFYPYVESVYDQLKAKFGYEPSHYLPIEYTIKRGPPGEIGGSTSEGKIEVKASDFSENRWCLVISAQELVNLFTGSICRGWPSDWWADHRSPFPIMVAIEIIRDLGYVQEADDSHEEFKGDPLYIWHREMKRKYGWRIYRNMFSAMKADGIQLDQLGPNPGKLRTNYVLAYMSIDTDELDLSSAATISSADLSMIQAIIRARQRIQMLPLTDRRWKQYLEGNYLRS